MNESNYKILKFICIIQLLLALVNYNFLGVLISILTYYGINKKNINAIKASLVPNIFETLILICCFIGYLIIIYSSFLHVDEIAINDDERKKDIRLNYIIFLLYVLQSLFQIFLTFSIYIIIKSYDEALYRYNEEMILRNNYYMSNQCNFIEEFEPLPEYTPPVKLPSYETLETDITNTTVIDFNSFKVTELDEPCDNQSISDSIDSEEETIISEDSNENVIITVDITNVIPNRINDDLLLPSPPPYSLYPNSN